MKEKANPALSNLELSSFCSQMTMILNSGISPTEGIHIMMEDSSPEDKAILENIRETLDSTGIFSQSLKDSGVFPDYMLNMITLGEQAGRLDEVMEALSLHYEREADIASAVRSAFTYPFVMIGMMVLVVLVLITKVLPVFSQIFSQFGQTMSGVSKTLMNMGTALNRYSLVFVVILVIIASTVFYFIRIQSGRSAAIRLLSHIKFTRDYYHKNAACRFASGMSLTLKSGLTPEEGLTMSKKLISNPVFLQKVNQCQTLLAAGTSLSESLAKSGIFTGVYARMVVVGERTGALDDVMQKIAVQYEEDLDASLNSAISVLEPTLVAVLSIIVGLILLSVMIPLMGILAGL